MSSILDILSTITLTPPCPLSSLRLLQTAIVDGSQGLCCLQRVCFPATLCSALSVQLRNPGLLPDPRGEGCKSPGGAVDGDSRKALRGASAAAFFRCPWVTHQSGLPFAAALIHPGLTSPFLLFTYQPLFLIQILFSLSLLSLERLIKCFLKALKRDSSANLESGSVCLLSQHRNKRHVGLNLRNETQTLLAKEWGVTLMLKRSPWSFPWQLCLG